MLQRFEQFTLMLARINRYVHIIEDMEMRKFGLKRGSVHCLLVLSMHPEGLTAAQLSHYCETDKAAISRLATHLKQEGLIHRNGEQNYRAPLVLSERGLQIAGTVRQKVLWAVSKAGEGLTEEERTILYKSFDIVAENLKTICEKEI